MGEVIKNFKELDNCDLLKLWCEARDKMLEAFADACECRQSGGYDHAITYYDMIYKHRSEELKYFTDMLKERGLHV